MALLFVLTVCLVFDINWGIYVQEEGRALHLASLVLDGEVPYRDFFIYGAPGRFYLLAGMFKLLGTSMMTCRLLSLTCYLMIAAGLFWLTRKLVPTELCLPGTFFISTWLSGFHGMPMLPVTVLLLGSCLLLHGVFERQAGWRLALAGLLVGLVMLLRHFVGLGALAAESAVLFLYFRSLQSSEAGGRTRRAIASLAPFLAGAALAVLPALAYFLWIVPADLLTYQLFTFPLQVYPSAQHLPFPSPLVAWNTNTSFGYWIVELSARLQLYVPFVALAAGLALLFFQRRNSPGKPLLPEQWTTLLVSALFLPAFGRMFSRPDKPHLLLALVLSNVLLALVLHHLISRRRRLAAGALALFLAAALIEPCWLKIGQLAALLREDGLYNMHLPRAQGIRRVLAVGKEASYSRAGRYEECIRFIQAHVPPGEAIYVGRERHDRIGWTDNLFYFLADRPCAIRQKVIEHGLTTQPDIQRQMIEDLEKRRVEYIVLANFNQSPEPEESGRSTEVVLLDQYLAERFQLEREFGSYLVYRKISPENRPAGPRSSVTPASSESAPHSSGSIVAMADAPR